MSPSISQLTPQYELSLFVATLKLKSPQKISHDHREAIHPKAHTHPSTKEAALCQAEHQHLFTWGQAVPTALPLTSAEHWGEARECLNKSVAGCTPLAEDDFHLLSSVPMMVTMPFSRKSWLK